jgi:hypothetical protein
MTSRQDASDAITRLRRFILNLAVRGKLVPQNASDEPAAELLRRIAKEKATLGLADGHQRHPSSHLFENAGFAGLFVTRLTLPRKRTK